MKMSFKSLREPKVRGYVMSVSELGISAGTRVQGLHGEIFGSQSMNMEAFAHEVLAGRVAEEAAEEAAGGMIVDEEEP
jgi:hypothetical protein